MSTPHVSQLFEPVTPVDHVLGSQNARITVIEYGAFECPICKQAASTVKLMLARFTPDIRFAFRHFPLEEAHPHALRAAEAAECAGGQGRFWEMHDLLFENQRHLQLRQLHEYAQSLGLDMARFTAEMDDEVYLQRVREHQESGRRSHVRATPGFFCNGRIVDVSYGMHALFDAVEAQLRNRS